MEEPIKAVENRREDGTFGPGNNANPSGRPKGQSLKEYWRQRFQLMTDEEKAEFSNKIGLGDIWRMAEGNPANATDLTTNGESLTPLLVKFLDNDSPDNGNTKGV